jgi:hypothetical protein
MKLKAQSSKLKISSKDEAPSEASHAVRPRNGSERGIYAASSPPCRWDKRFVHSGWTLKRPEGRAPVAAAGCARGETGHFGYLNLELLFSFEL